MFLVLCTDTLFFYFFSLMVVVWSAHNLCYATFSIIIITFGIALRIVISLACISEHSKKKKTAHKIVNNIVIIYKYLHWMCCVYALHVMINFHICFLYTSCSFCWLLVVFVVFILNVSSLVKILFLTISNHINNVFDLIDIYIKYY